eukprot:364910-Chlamydomonas_euryale.AAC.2
MGEPLDPCQALGATGSLLGRHGTLSGEGNHWILPRLGEPQDPCRGYGSRWSPARVGLHEWQVVLSVAADTSTHEHTRLSTIRMQALLVRPTTERLGERMGVHASLWGLLLGFLMLAAARGVVSTMVSLGPQIIAGTLLVSEGGGRERVLWPVAGCSCAASLCGSQPTCGNPAEQ